MKNHLLLILFLVILCASCTRSDSFHSKDDVDLEPIENYDSEEYSSFETRSSDIVETLYKKAVSQDPVLQNLDQEIHILMKDSLPEKTEAYVDYRNHNTLYWNTVTQYANSLEDTVARKNILQFITQQKEKYAKRIQGHEAEWTQLHHQKVVLQDQVKIMKILITQPLMEKYQQKALPPKEDLESINQDYQEVIEQTQKFTEIK